MRTPLPTLRPRRAALVLAVGALLATGTTACEPTGPPPAFTVVPAAAGADIDPGDGVCEDGDGRCSLRAAVEEANALDTPVEITVPAGEVAPADLTVTGTVELIPGGAGMDLADVTWTVAEDAQLTVTDAQLASVVVDGNLFARRVGVGADLDAVVSGVDALIDVGATGTALFANSMVIAWGAPAARNAGVLSLHGSTVALGAAPGPAAITTVEGGQTRLSASVAVADGTPVATCAGEAITSYGYNLLPDTSCALASPGDRQDFHESQLTAGIGSERVDTVPVGTLHCGAGWDDDARGPGNRPYDGDLDETPACDSGAHELTPAS